jgi:hypothetical protein
VAEFVPPDFEVPLGHETSEFVLEPLGPEHNEQDYDAWTSSMEHIAETPGYPDGSWPRVLSGRVIPRRRPLPRADGRSPPSERSVCDRSHCRG